LGKFVNEKYIVREVPIAAGKWPTNIAVDAFKKSFQVVGGMWRKG